MRTKWLRGISAFILLLILASTAVFAQRITGNIAGTVTDAQGAVVPNARISVTNEAMGVSLHTTSNAQGGFEIQNLKPAEYTVTVESGSFAPYTTKVPVKVGVSTPVQAKLNVGTVSSEVQVSADAVTVDTTQATIQGVITADRIQQMPLNGRNFLQLAGLEPGVQVVDGGSFDPTKNGFTGVSIGGRSGRVTRIQVDGVDITDETVGTTTTNLSNESIQQFGVAQSSLDPATDVTSSGAVNIITRSGSNNIHGSAFGFFRDAKFSADQRLDKTSPTTEKPPFDRQQWGGRLGGFFIKDKLFWEAEYEQNSQDSVTFTNIPEFPQFTNVFATPFDETSMSGRLDWNATSNIRMFYRFLHNHNIGTTGFGSRDLSSFANRNNTNTHVVGADMNWGNWTHSLRFSYLNFNNFINAANSLSGTPETLAPGGEPVLVRINGILQDVGPDLLAPQNTFQDNRQTKYDGGWIHGSHNVRFGFGWNHISEGGFASFFGDAPRIRASFTGSGGQVFAATNPFSSGGATDPLNYRLNQIVFGNGLGAFTEKPGFNQPFGAFYNDRIGIYAQDTWKVLTNLSITAGLRWNYNTALSDSDLPRASLLGTFDPTLAGKPRNPKADFAPQLGFAWDVNGAGKTVIRGGAGIFHETNIINNVFFDRTVNLPPGFGNDTPVISSGAPLLLDPGTGATLVDFSTACGGGSCFTQPLGAVIPVVAAAQAQLQAATAALTAGYPQPGVEPLFNQTLSTGGSVIDPDYHTPYGIQFNIGVQREIKNGLVFSADYVHNRGVHFNLVRDRNRLGAANTLDTAMAAAAIAATNADFGCADVACSIAAGATMNDYAQFGLCSGSALDGCAYRGMNPNFRDIGIIEGIGLSRFQALQLRLTGRVGSWGPFKNVNTNTNYQLGKFESTGADQDFLSAAGFNDNPTKFYGPANQDRRHQVGFAFQMELPWRFAIASSTQWKSPLRTSMFLPDTTADFDEIFYSDLDGDGVVNDPLPGQKPRGAFGTTANADNINQVITDFNTNTAGTITPAGQALIDNGLMTQAEVVGLGAVVSPIPLAPADQVNNDDFWNTDIRFSNRIRVTERVVVEPTVDIFNIFNIANYGRMSNTLLDGSTGSVNGTSGSVNVATRGLSRLGFGSGSFSPATQRAFQFGIRVTF